MRSRAGGRRSTLGRGAEARPVRDPCVVASQLGLVFRAQGERTPRGVGALRRGVRGEKLDPVRPVVAAAPRAKVRVSQHRAVGEIVRRAHLAQRPLEDRTHEGTVACLTENALQNLDRVAT